jgi:hypothetical protein
MNITRKLARELPMEDSLGIPTAKQPDHHMIVNKKFISRQDDVRLTAEDVISPTQLVRSAWFPPPYLSAQTGASLPLGSESVLGIIIDSAGACSARDRMSCRSETYLIVTFWVYQCRSHSLRQI